MYTNAQVADLVKALDAQVRALRAEVAALGGTVAPASAPAPVAATPVAIPERGQASARFTCAKHPDHKGERGFSRAGITAHSAWCDGAVTQK